MRSRPPAMGARRRRKMGGGLSALHTQAYVGVPRDDVRPRAALKLTVNQRGAPPARRTRLFAVTGQRLPPEASSDCGLLPGKPSESALSAAEIGDRGGESLPTELGPHEIAEVQLGVRALPQEEVAQAPFATRADEEVHVGDGVRLSQGTPQLALEAGSVGLVVFVGTIASERRGRRNDGRSGGVIDRDA